MQMQELSEALRHSSSGFPQSINPAQASSAPPPAPAPSPCNTPELPSYCPSPQGHGGQHCPSPLCPSPLGQGGPHLHPVSDPAPGQQGAGGWCIPPACSAGPFQQDEQDSAGQFQQDQAQRSFHGCDSEGFHSDASTAASVRASAQGFHAADASTLVSAQAFHAVDAAGADGSYLQPSSTHRGFHPHAHAPQPSAAERSKWKTSPANPFKATLPSSMSCPKWGVL